MLRFCSTSEATFAAIFLHSTTSLLRILSSPKAFLFAQPNEFFSCSFNRVCKASEDEEDWLNGVTIHGHPCGQFRGIRVSDD
ncbi:hypothetical protein BDZ91DRAFT_726129 [Kalaharituber pfeilii]|nr:hypothetical protein BDZ91DRAFT_726129 [Kalaharituber pfeilii]